MVVPLMVFANTKKLTVAMHCCCPFQLGYVWDPLLFLHLRLRSPQPQRKLPIPSETSPQRYFGSQLHAIPVVGVQCWVHLLCLLHPHVSNGLGSMLLSQIQVLRSFGQSHPIKDQMHVLGPPGWALV